MAEINNGGPAFPTMHIDCNGSGSIQGGMSLRDWFAGQALAGMLDFSGAHSYQFADDAVALEVATSAYEIADAMIRARGK